MPLNRPKNHEKLKTYLSKGGEKMGGSRTRDAPLNNENLSEFYKKKNAMLENVRDLILIHPAVIYKIGEKSHLVAILISQPYIHSGWPC